MPAFWSDLGHDLVCAAAQTYGLLDELTHRLLIRSGGHQRSDAGLDIGGRGLVESLRRLLAACLVERTGWRDRRNEYQADGGDGGEQAEGDGHAVVVGDRAGDHPA